MQRSTLTFQTHEVVSNTCCSNTARVSNNHVTFRQISSFFSTIGSAWCHQGWIFACLQGQTEDELIIPSWSFSQRRIMLNYESCKVALEESKKKTWRWKWVILKCAVGGFEICAFILFDPPLPSCIYYRCLCLQIATWATKWSLFKSNPTELYASLFNKRKNLISQRVS